MSQGRHEMAEVGPRVADWLRSNYHDALAKRVARQFDVSERQAQRWACGERPTPEHLSAMARHWGWRFVNFVFEGVIGKPPPIPETHDILVKLDRLDRELAELRNDLRGKDRG